MEISEFGDVKAHFGRLVDFVENYTVNGFANFSKVDSQYIDM